MNRGCPTCGSLELETNEASGDTVCTNCGTVLEESNIVSNIEFVETAAGTSSVIGQFVSATATKPYGSTGPGYGLSRESREVAIENGRRMIQQVAGQLHLTSHFVDAAHRLYILAVHHHFTQGRRTAHVVAACLYIVCRREKSPHLLIDFAEALQANLYTLGACFLKFTRLLSLNLPIIDPSLYIHRFAARMELGDSTHPVSMTALRLVARMKRDWIQTGRRPAGICGACLLIASRVHGFRRTRQEVMHIVRVTDITLRNRLAEFENTPASLLSAEEFDKLDNLEEADPPSYTRGLLDEAFAREAALLEDAYNADMNGDTLRLENGDNTQGTNSNTTTLTSGNGYFDPNAINVSAGTVPVTAAKALIDRPAISMLMERSHILDAEIAVSNAHLGVSSSGLRALADGSVDGNSHILGDDRTVDESIDGSRNFSRANKASSRHSMVSDVGSDIPLNHTTTETTLSTPLLTPEEQLLWKAKTLLSKNWGSAVGKFRSLLAEREREVLASAENGKENHRPTNRRGTMEDENVDEEEEEEEEDEQDSDAQAEGFVRRSRTTRGNTGRARSGRILRRSSSRIRGRTNDTVTDDENEEDEEEEKQQQSTQNTRSSSNTKPKKVVSPVPHGLDSRQKKAQLMYTELAADMAQHLQAGDDTVESIRAQSASIAAALSSKAIETAQELLNRSKEGGSSSKNQRKQKSSSQRINNDDEEDEENGENQDNDLAIVVHPTLGNSTRTLPSDPEIYERSRKLLSRTVGNVKDSAPGTNQSSSLQGPRYDVSDIATADVIAAANQDFVMPILDSEDTVITVNDDDNRDDEEETGNRTANKAKTRTARGTENSSSSSSSSSSDAGPVDDVEFYVLPSAEAVKRKDIWNSIYENYLKEREEKKKAESQVYRKLRPGSSRSSKGGATVTEAVSNLLSAPRLSKKLNYAAMQSLGNLFADENGDGQDNDEEIANDNFNTNSSTMVSSSSGRTAIEAKKGMPTTTNKSVTNNSSSSVATSFATTNKKRTTRANTEDFEDQGTVASKPSTSKRSKVTETVPAPPTVKAPTVKVTAPTVKATVPPTVKVTAPSVKTVPSVKVIAPAGNIGPATTTLSSSSSSSTNKPTTNVPVPIAKPGGKQIPPVVATKSNLSNSKLPPTRSAIPITKPNAVNKNRNTEDTPLYDDNEEFISETNKWGKSRRDDQGDDDGGQDDYD